MKEAVSHDFAKYASSIKQVYQQRVTKLLLLESACALALLGVALIITNNVKWLLVGVILATWLVELYRGLTYLKNFDRFLADSEAEWRQQIERINWDSPKWVIHENDNHYFIKVADTVQRLAKKGSRTMPSDNRGISLIVGENAQLLTRKAPIFIVYCDTTNIKHIDLAKKNAATIQQMQLTKIKNKVLRPLFYLIILLLIIWYLTRWLW